MAIDLRNGYADLASHVGHQIVCVTYAEGANVALECEDCSCVLIDFDRPEREVSTDGS